MEIAENSENHLKAIVGGRQVAGRDGFGQRAEKVVEKTQGEGKALNNPSQVGSRQPGVLLALTCGKDGSSSLA